MFQVAQQLICFQKIPPEISLYALARYLSLDATMDWKASTATTTTGGGVIEWEASLSRANVRH